MHFEGAVVLMMLVSDEKKFIWIILEGHDKQPVCF